MKKLFYILVVFVFLILISKINRLGNENKILNERIKNQPESVQSEDCSSSYSECLKFPWLDLPLNYFSVKDVTWGSIGGVGKKGTMDEYTQAAFNNKVVYQSYPTTNITIKEYSSDIVWPSSKKFSDLREEISQENNGGFMSTIDEIIKHNGQIAVNFFDNGQQIEMTDSFDVNNDGEKEKVLGLNFIGRADGGSYSAAIVKDNKIIFSVDEDDSFIVPADTTNGFFVEWRSSEDSSPLCCPRGYMRTRFVLNNGKFIPVYEQEIRYLIVGNKSN